MKQLTFILLFSCPFLTACLEAATFDGTPVASAPPGTPGSHLTTPSALTSDDPRLATAEELPRRLKPHYQLVDIETLGVRPASVAYKINTHGQFTGWVFDLEGIRHAYVFDGEGVAYPDDFGVDSSAGLDINNSGQAVGELADVRGSRVNYHGGFLYGGGQTRFLGAGGLPYDFIAQGINNSGAIVGFADPGGETYYGWEFNNGIAIQFPFNTFNLPRSINDAGQIAGGDGQIAELFDGTNIIRFGNLTGGIYSMAVRINQKGHVVGYLESGHGLRGFLYRDGALSNLDPLPGHLSSNAFDVNNADRVVGYSAADFQHPLAVLWDGAQIYDLNESIHAPRGYVLQYAYGINSGGQIVGAAFYQGKQRGFLLKPVQHPLPPEVPLPGE